MSRGSKFTSEHLLPMMLQAAVPLWIDIFQRLSPEERQAKLDEIDRSFNLTGLSFSESLIVGGKGAGDEFNKCAKSIALPSFCPGGVTCFGATWDAKYRCGIESLGLLDAASVPA
jgi:hypothetical protein